MPNKKDVNIANILSNNVASVATFKPKFNPQSGKIFSDELNVLGTAFWAGDKKVLITCAHVIEELTKSPVELAGLLVIGYKGNFYRASIGIVDNQHDIATLDIIDDFDVEQIPGIAVSKKYLSVSSKVAWSGYPLGNFLLNQVHQPTYNEGVVGIDKRVEKFRKYVQISGTVVGGYSGSPVIDSISGNLIGVVSNGPENTGIFMAVAFEHIEALINLKTS